VTACRGCLAAALAGLAALCALAPPAGAAALHVVPFPGTPDASPATQIIFSSLAPSQLRAVTVAGSRSGEHRGRLHVLPDGAGTAFAPNRPFRPGEAVHVSAALGSRQAGTDSGAPGQARLAFAFRIARPASQPGPSAAADRRGSTGRTQRFRSRGDLHPPALGLTSDADTGSGEFFITAFGTGQSGAMILNSRGQLVWFQPTNGGAFNLQVQRYRKQPVLTYWQGRVVDFHGAGEDVILDHHYRPVAVLHAGNGYSADLHEFQLTPQGTALIDAYVPVKTDLTSVGGPRNGRAYDCVIQELDIRTGKVLWEWHSLGHIPVSASYRGKPSSRTYQYLHLNSIQQLPNGTLLVSARNTWAVYDISKQTGNILWSVGGKTSSLKLTRAAQFEWQHDARLNGNNLTVFDDASSPKEEPQSSVKRIRLDFQARSASLVHSYTHTPALLAYNQGNGQTLPNGNLVVGWGSESQFSEYTPSGRQIFNGILPIGITTYRAYRFPWTGQPLAPPSLAIVPGPTGALNIYSSWNGATRVAAWRVIGGSTPGTLGWFDKSPVSGFETHLKIHSQPAHLAVQALSASGQVLGTSPVHAVPAHVVIYSPTAFARSALGTGAIPVGCFTGQACRLSLTISSGRTVISRSAPQSVPSGDDALLRFKLSRAGQRALVGARHQRLPIQVSIRDSSGATASTSMTLIPFSISGPSPPSGASKPAVAQVARTLAFVSPTGRGVLLTACHAGSACHVRASISVGGQVIAATGPEHVGAHELGQVFFQLTQSGRSLLAGASGNQLGADVELTDGSARASAQVDLVRYGRSR
jgi:hypothetical protein